MAHGDERGDKEAGVGDRPRPPTPVRHSSLTVAVALAGTLLVLAGVVVAWQRPGFAQVPPEPKDGSVWVTNDSRLLVGRVNTGIGELDSATALRGVSEVLQDPSGDPSDPVFVVDPGKHELQLLDTATVTLGARVAIPDDPEIALRAGTLAVADRADGRLWVGTDDDPAAVDVHAAEPVATVGALPVVAVSTSGTVYVTRPGASEVLRVSPGDDPASVALPDGPLSLGNPLTAAPAAGRTGDIQLTAVGETSVVLDRADSALRVDGRRIVLPALPDAVLQDPGPAADELIVSSSNGLLAVNLTDGGVRTIADAAGDPVSPVVVDGCRYAAWTGGPGVPATGLADCGTAHDPSAVEVAAGFGVAPILRARGDAVVLTDGPTGRSWIASDGFRPVDNWSDVVPPESDTDDSVTIDDPATSADLPRLPPDCTAVPVGEPRAVDDEFGVRAGRATVLRVLDNDPSVDCTSVVIDSVTPLPAGLGTVAVVGNGSALQVTVPDNAEVTMATVEYLVGNGRSATASARVSISVVPPGATAAPERVRRSAASAEVGGTVSYNVLDDMVSPVGEDLFLVSAATESADVVSFRPDGTITYRNTGAGAGGDVRVEFVVSDGVEQATGTLTVSIAPAGSGVPVAYPAYARAVAGAPAVAHPARSVVSGSAEPVTIGTVQPEPGSESVSAQLDPRTGAVTVTAPDPGSYYLTFEAATGGRGVTGVLRVDVVPAGDAARIAVPMLDVAYLPAGGEAVVDPLVNDTDPDGQGLAVRDVQEPAAAVASVNAAVVDLHLVRVSASRPLRDPADLTYTVFDGATAVNGQIRVVPVPAPRSVPAPLTAPVQVAVRAGDAVTVPITRFTTSQDGAPVTVKVDPAQAAALPGRVFVNGDAIRFLAAPDAEPGQVGFGYTASSGSADALHPAQSANTVTIMVTAADPDRNASPDRPAPVTARVFTGGGITVALPLAGIDPDGDWVTLQSIEQPEAPLGEVRVTGQDTLSYKAFGASGVDRIRYVAADPSGATVTGELTVLVVAPGESARPPVAPDLAVSVRPGASIRIDPLASVMDPGGQRVVLADPAFTATEGLAVQVDEQVLILGAPPEPTVGTLRYTVVNAKGLSASGTVRVTVSPDAPMPDPVAQDVFVQPADLSADSETVDVDVRGSVTNRSGRSEDLTVAVDELSAGQASLVESRTIRVTVSAKRQIVAYRITDANGAQAGAFIVVPPRAELYGPQLRSGVGPIQLAAGRSVDVAIGDYVTVGGAGQDSVTIAADPPLRATQGTPVRTSPTEFTLTAPSDAGGTAAVYVPIAGGTGPPVVLSLPVRIEPRLVPPPRLDSTDLKVEAGASASVDLAALTTTFDDQQAGSVTFGIGPGSDGVGAQVQGSTVTVTAAVDTPRGTRVDLPIQVVDGDGKDGRGTLSVTVTGSTKPLPTVADQQVRQGRGGIEVSVDLLTGSLDPVGLGLTVTGVRVVAGVAGVASGPTVVGGTVTLTPAVGFVGEIVVAADIQDGTRDPDRQVTATVRVQIQDRPSAPGVPAAVAGTLTAHSVQLQWEPADANGAPVQAYTVTGGGIRQECPGADSTCVIGDLTPGQAYVFVVTATNSVGESVASAPSAVIVPDVAPTVPAAPLAQYVARGEISVSWSVPTGDFTPVSSMSLQVLRGDQVVQVLDGASSPTPLTGLDSSGAYRFQVRADNQQGSSDWSAASDALVPSGVPSAPAGLSTQFVYDGERRGVQVGWTPPVDDGGEPIQSYRLLVAGHEAASGGAEWLSAFVPVDGTDPVDIAVIASNGRGDGPAATGSVAPFDRPAQVTGLTLTAGDSSLVARWKTAASAGRQVVDYQYRRDDGGWVSVGTSTSTTIGSLANGTEYTVEVRACNGETGYAEDVRCGPASDQVTGRPFGALADPRVDAAPTGKWASTIEVTWTFPGGNGRKVVSQTVQITGAVTENPASPELTGTWSGDIGHGKTVTVVARYCVEAGGEGIEAVGGRGECKEARDTVTTATAFSVATVALEPLTGTCGLPSREGGEWRTEADCAPGTWVPAPAQVQLVCTATGPEYPGLPAGNPGLPVPNVNQWYLGVNDNWYRKPALSGPDATIPTC